MWIRSSNPAPVWRKSSWSDVNQCVEVAELGGAIGIRDSKNPAGGHLELSPTAAAALRRRIRGGELDL